MRKPKQIPSLLPAGCLHHEQDFGFALLDRAYNRRHCQRRTGTEHHPAT
jgi:hypothetical protein